MCGSLLARVGALARPRAGAGIRVRSPRTQSAGPINHAHRPQPAHSPAHNPPPDLANPGPVYPLTARQPTPSATQPTTIGHPTSEFSPPSWTLARAPARRLPLPLPPSLARSWTEPALGSSSFDRPTRSDGGLPAPLDDLGTPAHALGRQQPARLHLQRSWGQAGPRARGARNVEGRGRIRRGGPLACALA